MRAERAAPRCNVGRGALHIALLATCLVALLASGCGWNPFGGATFKAMITDQAGLPLPGAVASSGGKAAIADARGHVELAGVQGRVWVQKTGYGRLEVEAHSGAVTLAKRNTPLKVVWDERFGATVPMTGLQQHLVQRGFAVVTLGSGTLSEDADVVVLSCPSWFNEQAYTQYMRAANAGTKLVLLGEWGGYDGIDLAALTALSSKAGISFESGQVRTYASSGLPQAWMAVKDEKSPLASGLTAGVTVFTAGVLSITAPAQAILTTEASAIRILRWDVGPQTLAAIGPLGRSQVVAIADSSLFSDEKAPDGQPQWKASDNARFAENVLSW
jgi:hypothetical protein